MQARGFRKIFQYVFFLILLFIPLFAVSKSRAESKIITDEGAKRYFIWFEVNQPSGIAMYVKHANTWYDIGDLIVTARMSNIESLLKRLEREHIPVIGGFKTVDAFSNGNIYDKYSWGLIAKVARRVSDLTNGRPVVLENEGALKALLAKGISSIDHEKLAEVISSQEWPEIWFWYAPTGRRKSVQDASYHVARAIMGGIPHARLIEPSSSGYAESHIDSISKYNLARTHAVDKNPISIVYVGDHNKRFWKLNDVYNAVNNTFSDTVIIYPGFNNIGHGRAVEKNIKVPNHYNQKN